MEYTVQKLANIAGLSTRTLRYYDQIGLLKPARTNSSGYRIYGQAEVDQLQQILFYRELGMDLEMIRSKYGDDVMNKSDEKLRKMTQEEYGEWNRLRNEVKSTLSEAFKTGNPASEIAQDVADLHRQWLTFTWDKHRKEAHAGLAQLYVDDEQFRAFYDTEEPGMARFLRDAIHIYTGYKQ